MLENTNCVCENLSFMLLARVSFTIGSLNTKMKRKNRVRQKHLTVFEI
jgi:hypothetical protein